MQSILLLALSIIGTRLPDVAVAVPAASFFQGVYMCTDVFWGNGTDVTTSQCQWLQHFGSSCVQLRDLSNRDDWYRRISSYGPDPGLSCTIHDGDNCTGSSRMLVYPGVDDLRLIGWNDRIASYNCDGRRS